MSNPNASPTAPTFEYAISILCDLESPTFDCYAQSALRHPQAHQVVADLFCKSVDEVRTAVNEALEAANHFFIREGSVFVRVADEGRRGDVVLGSVDTENLIAALLSSPDVDWKGLSSTPALEAQDVAECRAWLESQGYQVAVI